MGLKRRTGYKKSDAEWLRNIFAPPEAQARFHAIADRLEAIDGWDGNPKPDTEIDFVEWRRFVGMLRKSADDVKAAEGEELHPTLACLAPRLREAATRIEKVAEIANKVVGDGTIRVPSLFVKVLSILNGRYQ